MPRRPLKPLMPRSQAAHIVRGIRRALDVGDCKTAYKGVAALLTGRAPMPGKSIARLQLATARCQVIRRRSGLRIVR